MKRETTLKIWIQILSIQKWHQPNHEDKLYKIKSANNEKHVLFSLSPTLEERPNTQLSLIQTAYAVNVADDGKVGCVIWIWALLSLDEDWTGSNHSVFVALDNFGCQRRPVQILHSTFTQHLIWTPTKGHSFSDLCISGHFWRPSKTCLLRWCPK